MKKKIQGRVWRFGSNIDTDQIIPAEYLVTADVKTLAKHAFERVRPEFAKEVKRGDVIVARENFGCGSSREHAPIALLGAGIACIISGSFARIFFRNSINIGLPLVECDIEAKDGDNMMIDFGKGIARNLNTGEEVGFPSLPDFLLNIIESGGLVEYTKKELSKG